MAQQPLPSNPDLDQLADLAEMLRDLVRAGDADAIEVVREHHPRHVAIEDFELADARVTLARQFGFENWPELERRVELVKRLARSPHAQEVGADGAEPADELLRLGCLTYGVDDASKPNRARALLDSSPELAVDSPFTMAATGRPAELRALLDHSPDLVDRAGGPFDWPPLLYAAYSRIPDADTVAAAEVLLEAGADPDPGYLWEGLIPPFTALTGVLGGGEHSQAEHARSLDFARLLLTRGADPNDGQAVYNRATGGGAHDDTEWLELLFEFGLGTGDGGPWYRLLAPSLGKPHELVGELLQHAAEKGLVQRTRLLLDRGADPNGTGMHPGYGGRTAYRGAVTYGNGEVAALLEAAGADQASISVTERLAGQLLATSEASATPPSAEAVKALIAERPGLVLAAVNLGRPVAVRRLVEQGFDVNHLDGMTALHSAASSGRAPMVALLLELGADLSIEDSFHGADPAGWAAHNGHDDIAELLNGRA